MLYRAGHSGQGRAELNGQLPVHHSDEPSPVGGITPFTTVDMPDHMSAVCYMQGCPYRCPYCHNPQFQREHAGSYTIEQVDEFLHERTGFLDAVVFSGGEPLMDPHSVMRMGRLAMTHGYRLGLHTTGYAPDHLMDILESLDIGWVGLDLKSSPQDLDVSTGVRGASLAGFMQSLEHLRRMEIPTEVRTTIHFPISHEASLDRLVGILSRLQVESPVWQIEAVNGRPDPELKKRVSAYLESRRLTSWIAVR